MPYDFPDMEEWKIQKLEELDAIIGEHKLLSHRNIRFKISTMEKELKEPEVYLRNIWRLPETEYQQVYLPAEIEKRQRGIEYWLLILDSMEQKRAILGVHQKERKRLQNQAYKNRRRELTLIRRTGGLDEATKDKYLLAQFARSRQSKFMTFQEWKTDYLAAIGQKGMYIPPTKTEQDWKNELFDRVMKDTDDELHIPDPMVNAHIITEAEYMENRKSGGDYRYYDGILYTIDKDGQAVKEAS